MAFSNLSQEQKRRIGIIYRNLQHFGFKKSLLGISDYVILKDVFGLTLPLRDTSENNGFLIPSEYVLIMQAIYDLYEWGKYDTENEVCWLLDRIKSPQFHAMRNRTYGECDYTQLVNLVYIYKQHFNLKIDLDTI